MRIQQDSVVTIRATIDVDGAQGQPPRVMSFVYGSQRLLFDLDSRLEGLEPGQTAAVGIKPFGEHRPELVRQLAAADIIDAPEEFVPGQWYDCRTAQGEQLSFRLTAIDNGLLQCDFNHPSAGRTMTVSAQVLDVRPATLEELTSARSCRSA